MIVEIEKSIACGCISAPASKSMAHRLLISASCAAGESIISGVTFCEDVLATIDCLTELGAKFSVFGDTVRVWGYDFRKSKPDFPLLCRESGSTLRFLIPLALLSGNKTVFLGAKRLIERPHEIYEKLCFERGYLFEKDCDGITVSGTLTAGNYYAPANVSSQFISGLLFALAALEGKSQIHLTTEIESKSYIDLTLSALNIFGVNASFTDERTITVEGGGYSPREAVVEGDYSAAAFIEAFNLFGGKAEVLGLSPDSLQGDRIYREHFVSLTSGTPTINIENCPDLGPILFAVAAALNGAVFTGTRRLKIKESDRASVMAEELRKFGADITVSENSVIIKKAPLHKPKETLLGHNDHRVVMSLAVLCSVYGGRISGFEAIKKSYPDFLKDIQTLGIKAKIHET